jgi:hypothetical protein
MTPTYFHCLICNTPCQPLHENKDDQTTTVDGMFIRAHGNYGSTHFDPLSHDQYLEAVICNLCTIAKHTHFRRYHQGRLAPWHPTIANRPIIPTSTATFHHNPLTPTKDQPHTFTITPNPTPQEAHHILLHSHAIKQPVQGFTPKARGPYAVYTLLLYNITISGLTHTDHNTLARRYYLRYAAFMPPTPILTYKTPCSNAA